MCLSDALCICRKYSDDNMQVTGVILLSLAERQSRKTLCLSRLLYKSIKQLLNEGEKSCRNEVEHSIWRENVSKYRFWQQQGMISEWINPHSFVPNWIQAHIICNNSEMLFNTK